MKLLWLFQGRECSKQNKCQNIGRGHLKEGYLRKRSQMKESAHINLTSVPTFFVLKIATVASSNLFLKIRLIGRCGEECY